MQPPHILVVDHDTEQRHLLHEQLSTAGYRVSAVNTAESALRVLSQESPHLITIDLCLPDIPGAELCARIRAQSCIPIVVVSRYDHEALKARVLDIGADDIVVKPVACIEFLARVRAALRRADAWSPPMASPPAPSMFRLGDLVIDLEHRRVARGEQAIHLRCVEWGVLGALLQTPSQVVTQTQIIEAVWGSSDPGRRASLHVAISNLRQALGTGNSGSPLIVNAPGVGYRIEVSLEASHPVADSLNIEGRSKKI